MTQKDYELIAGVMYHAHPGARKYGEPAARWQQWEATMQQFVVELSAENPRFDAVKFVRYCTHGSYV